MAKRGPGGEILGPTPILVFVVVVGAGLHPLQERILSTSNPGFVHSGLDRVRIRVRVRVSVSVSVRVRALMAAM